MRRSGHDDWPALADSALRDARLALELRTRFRPKNSHLIQRERLGAALAATGDPEGLDVLLTCLEERFVKLDQGMQIAETRWLVNDIEDALRDLERKKEAETLRTPEQILEALGVPPKQGS